MKSFAEHSPLEGEPVSVHLIGISGYARAVLHSLSQVIGPAGAKIVAATVINRQEEEARCRALEAEGCRVYTDYESMLAGMRPGRNLCIIPTSIALHAPMTVAAVQAGADVLVEKPLAGCVADAQQILLAGRFSGRSIAVGFQDMYAPQVHEIKRALTERAIGRIRTIRITASWPRGAAYYARNRWAGRKYCDGRPVFDSPLNNAFAHFINLALFFSADAPEGISEVASVSGRLLRFFPIETFDTAQVVFFTTDGVEIECLLTHAGSERLEPNIEIQGDRGTLSWHQESMATLRGAQGDTLRTWRLHDEEANRRGMLARVLSDTREGKPPLCSAAMALRHVEAVQLAVGELDVEDGPAALELERSDPDANWKPIPGLMRRLLEDGQAVDP